MANFSVECLARSYYEEMTPRAKDAALHSRDLSEIVEFTKESRSRYSAASLNNSCDNSSGSESEVGDDSEGEATQQRRLRTKFTYEQLSKLEHTFSQQKYLGATQRRKIAEELNLSETQVKTWFQNRRMKLKREVQDRRTEFLTVQTSLLPPMLFQHHFLPGQLPASCGFYPQLQPLPAPLHHHRPPARYPPAAKLLLSSPELLSPKFLSRI